MADQEDPSGKLESGAEEERGKGVEAAQLEASDEAPASELDEPGEPRAPIGARSSEGARGLIVVGIGASAGGLEALRELFANLSDAMDAAYVIVTHQHPEHSSLMAEILRGYTSMPVQYAATGMRLRPNEVFVAPPGFQLSLSGGVLELERGNLDERKPIDHFFASLAQDQGSKAIALILSGSGSDGTEGLKMIKDRQGLCIVQEGAAYSSMPNSALASGNVDLSAPVAEIADVLQTSIGELRQGHPRSTGTLGPAGDLRRIISILRRRTKHDFSSYKASTIQRRVQRRMDLHNLRNLHDYARFLEGNDAEMDALLQELLINVTSFFRDAEAFQLLGETIIPQMLESKPDDYEFRVWVPGCSTGEEAYSIAMLFKEAIAASSRHCTVQIFATDLDARAIEVARSGRYPLRIADDISPERLSRFFASTEHYFQINKELREMIVFAPQNLLQDPPFTRLDLIACRNLLIYLDASAQNRLLPIFHYALRPEGVLFLGSSESIGVSEGLFVALDKRWKIFRRTEAPTSAYSAGFPASVPRYDDPKVVARVRGVRAGESGEDSKSQNSAQTDRFILQELVPPTVLCNADGEILHILGKTGDFLELSEGTLTRPNLFSMVREGLKLSLLGAVRQAGRSQEDVVHRSVRYEQGGGTQAADIRVRLVRKPERYSGLYLVSFEHAPESAQQVDSPDSQTQPYDRTTELLRELEYTKAAHQETVEQLQSSNEELETSKEEMQSLNEELHTVNAELQSKLAELAQVNDDMKNLLNASDIATIFVDNHLRIKRYTEQVKRIANLIPGDIGRPFADLVSKLNYPELLEDANEVLETLSFKETEVPGPDATWYQVRILPYRTTDNAIDGLVMTFIDITKIKELRETERKMAKILSSSLIWVFGNNREGRYTWSSEPGPLGYSSAQIVGKRDEEFLPAEAATTLREVKQRALETERAVREYVELDVEGSRKKYDFRVEPIHSASGELEGVACVLFSVLERE